MFGDCPGVKKEHNRRKLAIVGKKEPTNRAPEEKFIQRAGPVGGKGDRAGRKNRREGGGRKATQMEYSPKKGVRIPVAPTQTRGGGRPQNGGGGGKIGVQAVKIASRCGGGGGK